MIKYTRVILLFTILLLFGCASTTIKELSNDTLIGNQRAIDTVFVLDKDTTLRDTNEIGLKYLIILPADTYYPAAQEPIDKDNIVFTLLPKNNTIHYKSAIFGNTVSLFGYLKATINQGKIIKMDGFMQQPKGLDTDVTEFTVPTNVINQFKMQASKNHNIDITLKPAKWWQ